MVSTKQRTKGDNSPAINVGDVSGDLQIQISGKSTTASEFQAVLSVIEKLSVIVEKIEVSDEGYVKDPSAKLQKYSELTPLFQDDYVKLRALYGNTYTFAWQASEVTEIRKRKVDVHLSYWSNEVLTRCDNDPLEAFKQLTQEVVNLAGVNLSQFDANAIRFFIYQEFANCHIFSFKEDEQSE